MRVYSASAHVADGRHLAMVEVGFVRLLLALGVYLCDDKICHIFPIFLHFPGIKGFASLCLLIHQH